MPDPLTIIIVVVAIAVLWILFRILLGMAAALFRVGCFIIFIVAIAVLIWNVLL